MYVSPKYSWIKGGLRAKLIVLLKTFADLSENITQGVQKVKSVLLSILS